LTLSQRTRRVLLFEYLLSLQTNRPFGTLSPARGLVTTSYLPLTPIVYHITGKLSIVKLYKNAGGKLAKLYKITNSARRVRERAAQKNAPVGKEVHGGGSEPTYS
jgi:hypothetical protein